MATIKTHLNFDVKADCTVLHSLFHDEKAGAKKLNLAREMTLIEMLTRRSYKQRQDIVYNYREMYGRYLAQDIRAAVTGHLRDALLTLICPYAVRDATTIHKALTGLPVGVDEHALLEILCSRGYDHLHDVAVSYMNLFQHDLAKELKKELSGKFQLQVMKLMRERRSEASPDSVRTQEIVRDLHEAAYGRWGRNKLLMYDVITRESLAQLRCVFKEYEKQYREPFLSLVNRVFTGELRKLVTYIATYAESEVGFYALMLHKAVVGETCDKTVFHKVVYGHSSQLAAFIRIILSRCDIDLETIIDVYERVYGESLKKDICSHTDGELRTLLLYACGWQNAI